MTITLGLIIFVLVVGGYAAVRKMRGHISQLQGVIARQEADLMTCVEAQRHTSAALWAYSDCIGQLSKKFSPEVDAVLHELSRRLAHQGQYLAQALSHWDGRSDPRALFAHSEADTEIEQLVLALEDEVLNHLWATRRPADVAQMVWHLIGRGMGEASLVEQQLKHDGRLYLQPTEQSIVEAWQRPAAEASGAAT